MKEVTFGQYYPSHSFVHKMNSAIKILLSIAYIVAVFLVSSDNYFTGFALLTLVVIFITLLARIPLLRMLKSIKAIIFFVILSAVLQIFFNKQGSPLWENGFITDKALLASGFIALRIILVVLGASLLTFTTSPVEIADGIEVLLAPLKIIKFPAHEFALIMSIALRFIPTLLDEVDRIIKAQQARGAEFEGGIIKKAKALIPVLIPLLIGSFRRADELADAMDSRCYSGSKNRTKYKKMTISFRDILGTIFMAGLIFGTILLNGVVLI